MNYGMERNENVAKADYDLETSSASETDLNELDQIFLAQNDAPVSKQSLLWASNHFLLHPGAQVIIPDSLDGNKGYEFALANPRLRIIGQDENADAVAQATNNFKLPNLSYEVKGLEERTNIDGFLNYFNLHHLYSISGYSQARVFRYLQNQLEQLKVGGMIVMHGYLSPDNNENNHVLLELSDYSSNSQSLKKLSEAELLIRFSQTAKKFDRKGHQGFYLEELEARIKHTRLFRLSHKWANEFLLRKDKRAIWDDEINKEYTPFTMEELSREVFEMGARLVYAAPYWDKETLETKYIPRCRIFDESGNALEYPATSFVAVIQKIDSPQSTLVREQRPSEEKPHYLKVDHVRDETSGKIYDLISRPHKIVDIIPFRINMDGRLTIYARDGYARPIINTVPRKGVGLDGKIWSGHLVEPITFQTSLDDKIDAKNNCRISEILDKSTKLKMKPRGRVIEGPNYYASPTMIDELVTTFFVEVENPKKNKLDVDNFEDGFYKKGYIKGLDAQDIIKAAHVGLLPDGNLELATYFLMDKLGMTPDTWSGESVPVGKYIPKRRAKTDDLIKDITAKDNQVSYKKTLRDGDTLSIHRSLFVEEGFENSDSSYFLAKNLEFAIPKEETINIAVVLPLTQDLSGEILAGFQMVDYPVPSRLEGQSKQLDAASFVLPRSVKNIFDAKKFIAKQFEVKPNQVGVLGSSYFSENGLTPQRIYPFVVASPVKGPKFISNFIYAPIKDIYKISYKWLKPKHFLALICETLHGSGGMNPLAAKPGREAIIERTRYKPSFSNLHTRSEKPVSSKPADSSEQKKKPLTAKDKKPS